MAEVGIFITAKDLATSALKKIGQTGKKNLNVIKNVASAARGAFSMLGGAISSVNQAMELGKKAWEIGRLAMEQTVGVALRFRDAGDPVLKWFKDMKRDTDLLKARIGDALIPVIQGFTEHLGLAGRGMANWVKENRKLIASKVLQFVINLGRVLVKSVGKGVLLVVKAWGTWRQMIALAESGINDFFAITLEGISSTASGMAELADLVGAGGVAASLRDAAAASAGLSEEFSRSSAKAQTEFENMVVSADALERQINSGLTVALVTLAKTEEAVAKQIAESQAGLNVTLEEQMAAREESKKAEHERDLERISRLKEAKLKAAQEHAEMLEQEKRLTSEIGSIFGGVTAGVIEGFAAQDDASKVAVKSMAMGVIDAVTAMIAGYAAEGAAAAFANYAGIPVVGPAIGAAAAAVVGGSILALGAGLKGLVAGLAGGGVITGGRAGTDTVGPFMLSNGEQVMSVGERTAMQKFMTRLLGAQAGHSAVGLAGPNAAQSGQPSVVVNQKTELRTWAPQITEEMRMARRLEKRSRKKMAQQGMLLGQNEAMAF